MAKWSDIITLIKIVKHERDGEGFAIDPLEEYRDVFADSKSVGYSEFYKANHEGYKAEIKFCLRMVDYQGEELIRHGGKLYKVIRNYTSKNGEIIELTCSDLSQRGEAIGDDDD